MQSSPHDSSNPYAAPVAVSSSAPESAQAGVGGRIAAVVLGLLAGLALLVTVVGTIGDIVEDNFKLDSLVAFFSFALATVTWSVASVRLWRGKRPLLLVALLVFLPFLCLVGAAMLVGFIEGFTGIPLLDE